MRSEGEALIRAAGLNATILRPWYVLGPGHRWPVVLIPAYWLAERLPPAMIPQVVHVAAALPRTSAGKLDRVTIMARLTEGGHLP